MRTTLKRMFHHGLLPAWLSLAALPAPAVAAQAEMLVYRVQSPGEETYFSRLLATPAYLRLDQGAGDSGYILFDRKQQVIYSVTHEDHSILVIDPPPKPPGLETRAPALSLQEAEPANAPAVGGVKPHQWTLSAEGRSCRLAFVLPGLMPQAVAAYAEYLGVLARQQAVTLEAMPPEFQDACDSAIHVFAPGALLEKGLILKAWDDSGFLEELVDFRQDVELPDADFTLPETYRHTPMSPGI